MSLFVAHHQKVDRNSCAGFLKETGIIREHNSLWKKKIQNKPQGSKLPILFSLSKKKTRSHFATKAASGWVLCKIMSVSTAASELY